MASGIDKPDFFIDQPAIFQDKYVSSAQAKL